jgi:hypothetical protein
MLRNPMTKVACLFTSVCLLALSGGSFAQQQQQYPILDKLAAKVITKYQTTPCQQLIQEKTQKAPPSPEEQKVIAFLKSDAQMRTVFLNKVAAPIANKMFECGMIP